MGFGTSVLRIAGLSNRFPKFGSSSENRPLSVVHVTFGPKERQLEGAYPLAGEPNFHGGIMNTAFS